MIDWTINVSHLITLAFAIGGGIAAWIVLRTRVGQVEKDLTEIQSSLDAGVAEIKKALEAEHNSTASIGLAVNTQLRMLQERIEDIRAKGAHELAEFKLEVARYYAGHEALREMEMRLTKAIDALGARIDERPRRRPQG